METEEYVALGGLITIIASSLALVIKQIESSRCTDIDCCGSTCKTSAAANLLEGSALSKAARAVARLRAMLTGVGTGGDYCRAPNSAILPFK